MRKPRGKALKEKTSESNRNFENNHLRRTEEKEFPLRKIRRSVRIKLKRQNLQSHRNQGKEFHERNKKTMSNALARSRVLKRQWPFLSLHLDSHYSILDEYRIAKDYTLYVLRNCSQQLLKKLSNKQNDFKKFGSRIYLKGEV